MKNITKKIVLQVLVGAGVMLVGNAFGEPITSSHKHQALPNQSSQTKEDATMSRADFDDTLQPWKNREKGDVDANQKTTKETDEKTNDVLKTPKAQALIDSARTRINEIKASKLNKEEQEKAIQGVLEKTRTKIRNLNNSASENLSINAGDIFEAMGDFKDKLDDSYSRQTQTPSEESRQEITQYKDEYGLLNTQRMSELENTLNTESTLTEENTKTSTEELSKLNESLKTQHVINEETLNQFTSDNATKIESINSAIKKANELVDSTKDENGSVKPELFTEQKKKELIEIRQLLRENETVIQKAKDGISEEVGKANVAIKHVEDYRNSASSKLEKLISEIDKFINFVTQIKQQKSATLTELKNQCESDIASLNTHINTLDEQNQTLSQQTTENLQALNAINGVFSAKTNKLDTSVVEFDWSLVAGIRDQLNSLCDALNKTEDTKDKDKTAKALIGKINSQKRDLSKHITDIENSLATENLNLNSQQIKQIQVMLNAIKAKIQSYEKKEAEIKNGFKGQADSTAKSWTAGRTNRRNLSDSLMEIRDNEKLYELAERKAKNAKNKK